MPLFGSKKDTNRKSKKDGKELLPSIDEKYNLKDVLGT